MTTNANVIKIRRRDIGENVVAFTKNFMIPSQAEKKKENAIIPVIENKTESLQELANLLANGREIFKCEGNNDSWEWDQEGCVVVLYSENGKNNLRITPYFDDTSFSILSGVDRLYPKLFINKECLKVYYRAQDKKKSRIIPEKKIILETEKRFNLCRI